jgi:hypothetical protein
MITWSNTSVLRITKYRRANHDQPQNDDLLYMGVDLVVDEIFCSEIARQQTQLDERINMIKKLIMSLFEISMMAIVKHLSHRFVIVWTKIHLAC